MLFRSKILAVHNFGAGDLFEIQPEAAESFYLPFTNEIIKDINLGEGILIAEIPDGWLKSA